MKILPKKVKIKHCDGKTDVMAKTFVFDDRVEFEYRFDGMSYGRTVNIAEAVKMGIIITENITIEQLKKGDRVLFNENEVGTVWMIRGGMMDVNWHSVYLEKNGSHSGSLLGYPSATAIKLINI